MTDGTFPLSSLPSRARGIVSGFDGGHQFRERLLSMGLQVGADIEVIHGSRGGRGPVLVKCGQTRIAIGCGMSERVQIKVDNS